MFLSSIVYIHAMYFTNSWKVLATTWPTPVTKVCHLVTHSKQLQIKRPALHTPLSACRRIKHLGLPTRVAFIPIPVKLTVSCARLKKPRCKPTNNSNEQTDGMYLFIPLRCECTRAWVGVLLTSPSPSTLSVNWGHSVRNAPATYR